MKPEDQTATGVGRGWSFVVLAWLLIAVAAPAAVFWSSESTSPEPAAAADGAPTLASSAAQALATQRTKVQAWLDSYGWIDREAGVARVPIEEGMKAVLQEGLPTRDETEEPR